MIKKNKNSLFDSGSIKKPRLIGLCDGRRLVTTYCAATDAATDLQTIEIRIANEDRIVKTAFSSKSAENRGCWIEVYKRYVIRRAGSGSEFDKTFENQNSIGFF
jgi:hypothetical protein